MFDASALAQLTAGTPAQWATFAVIMVALIKVWPLIKGKIIEARQGEAHIADNQWKRLLEWIERLEARIETLEAEVTECHRERDAALAEVARLEAINLGFGQARQRAAEMVAGDRAARETGDGK